MAEEKKTQSNRDRYAERAKSRHPDKEWADDEALWGQVNDDFDEYEGELSRYREDEKMLSDMMAKDPRSGSFLSNWRKGGDPVVELVRMFGDDFVEQLQDPEKQEALAQASKEFADRVTKEQEYEKEYQENIQNTLSTLESLQTERGLSDEEIDEAMGFLIGIVRDGILGKFSPETIDMAFRALHHDSDVATAAREGEVKGRNTRIEERLRRRGRGDGTASLDGARGGTGGRDLPDMGALDRYGDGGMTIWERGNERRVKTNR